MTKTAVSLTQNVKAAGCAAKLGPADLAQILHNLPTFHHPDVIVGTETSDDAGVFRLRADLAIVNTVDFFTPIVDDPFTFGQIAATNAISDIYAMGAEPRTALNIVGFPRGTMDIEVLGEILRGGGEKAQRGRSRRDRRPQPHRRRSEIRDGRHRRDPSRPRHSQRRRPARRRARADQSPRHRHHHDGAQAAEGDAGERRRRGRRP